MTIATGARLDKRMDARERAAEIGVLLAEMSGALRRLAGRTLATTLRAETDRIAIFVVNGVTELDTAGGDALLRANVSLLAALDRTQLIASYVRADTDRDNRRAADLLKLRLALTTLDRGDTIHERRRRARELLKERSDAGVLVLLDELWRDVSALHALVVAMAR